MARAYFQTRKANMKLPEDIQQGVTREGVRTRLPISEWAGIVERVKKHDRPSVAFVVTLPK